jgi:molybdopterin synthase sulfur carrier subunit
MTYHVSYFGLLAERRGLSDESFESDSVTPRALYQEIDAHHRLGLTVSDMRAAVNDEFVSWDHPLSQNDRVAFLPPMSGG